MKVFDRRTVERCATVLVATLPLLLPATTSVAFVIRADPLTENQWYHGGAAVAPIQLPGESLCSHVL